MSDTRRGDSASGGKSDGELHRWLSEMIKFTMLLVPKHSNGNAWMYWVICTFFGCCSTVKHSMGKKFQSGWLRCLCICQGTDDYHMYSLVVDAFHFAWINTSFSNVVIRRGDQPCKTLFTYRWHSLHSSSPSLLICRHVAVQYLWLRTTEWAWEGITGLNIHSRVHLHLSIPCPGNTIVLFICHNAMRVS